MLTLFQPPLEVQQAIDLASQNDSGLQLAFFRLAGDTAEEAQLHDDWHRQAALSSPNVFAWQHFESARRQQERLGITVTQYLRFPTRLLEHEPKSEAISTEEFLYNFHYAFWDRPYPLDRQPEHEAAYQTIIHYLLDDSSELPSIYSWSNDWSEYFDLGKEWWGAFLWTISHARAGWIISIGACCTD